MDISTIHHLFLNCFSVSIDTRTIENNSLFIALKGEKFNSNALAKEALDRGASYVIIDDNNYYIDSRTILVDDSLITLQELAKYHRQYLNLPIIAVTGSNGKTTTKELIYCVLSQKYNTKATRGNLNNHIGVPLTILSFDKSTEIGIVEMGANHQQEIDFLCNICLPNYGYITNFGKAHLEGFGGINGVIKGKSELYNYLHLNHKTAFVNLDDTIQNEKTQAIKRITFSTITNNCDLFVEKTAANPLVELTFRQTIIKSNLIGLYNATNITIAITIGSYFKVSDKEIKSAIEKYIPENNRSQLITTKTNKVILDAYNANPSSMQLAINNFIKLAEKNKVVILGDMLELGTATLQEHESIIHLMDNHENIKCYFVGQYFNKAKIIRDHYLYFKTIEELLEHTSENELRNKFLFIKGSRALTLEKLMPYL